MSRHIMGLTQRQRIKDVNERGAILAADSDEGTPWLGSL